MVIVVGQDDLLLPSACEHHERVMEATKSPLSASRVAFIDAGGQAIPNNVKSVSPYRLIGVGGRREVVVPFQQLADLALVYGNVTGEPCGTAFLRAAFEAVDGYDPSFQHSVDIEFALRVAQKFGRVHLSSRVLSRRRLHSTNATHLHLKSGLTSADRRQLFDRYCEAVTSQRIRRRGVARLITHDAFDAFRRPSGRSLLSAVSQIRLELVPALVRHILEDMGAPPVGRRWLRSAR